jgi:hypothetical protein
MENASWNYRGTPRHFEVFKQLNNNAKRPWKIQVIYFAKSWFDNLRSEAKRSLFVYLLDTAWENSSFLRNQIFMTITFNYIRSLINMRPTSHLANTLKHLITIIYGGAPGFSIADNDLQVPLKLIQKCYKDIYGLEYDPVIIQPAYLNSDPIYYSLSHEAAIDYAARDSSFETLINELIFLKDFSKAFKIIIQQQKNVLKIGENTLLNLNHIIQTNLDFYHSTPSLNEGVKPIEVLIKDDPRFGKNTSPYSPFFKGLIQIKPAK